MFQRTFKVIMLGDNAVGKTSLLNRFLRGEFQPEYIPTMEVNISEKEFTFSKYTVKLLFWDANGKEVLDKDAANYFGNAKAAIIVYDVCRPSSLTFAEEQYRRLVETLGYKPVVWLVGNKRDQENRMVDRALAEGKAGVLGIGYIETSAKTGENVEELFMAVLRDLVKARLGEVKRVLEG